MLGHSDHPRRRHPLLCSGALVAASLALVTCGRTRVEEFPVPSGGLVVEPMPDVVEPQFDVLTQHVDVGRTGANMSEALLTTTNVNANSFGKLWSVPVDGLIYAQPLYVSHYAVGGKTRNVLIVGTAHNSVYAFDADDDGDSLWQVSLGPSVPSAVIPTGNIQVEIGILSTPAIDREKGLLYVTNTTYFPDTPDTTCATHIKNLQQINLHVLSLATGLDAPGSPVVIAATVPGAGSLSGTTITFHACMQAQRPGILLLNGTAYLAFASHEDDAPYHGWILGYQYDAMNGTLTQTQVFNTTPDGIGGGIWHGGQGLAADSGGNVYAIVSNGTSNVQDGGQSYGMSFIKLSANLEVEDWYTAGNYAELNEDDVDLGSGGPVLIPGTHRIVGGGKQGIVYLLDTSNMGHLDLGDNDNLQKFQATRQENDGLFGGPIFWNNAESPRYYIWGASDVLRAFSFSNGQLSSSPAATSQISTLPVPAGDSTVGALAVSSNESVPGTGIVWAAIPESDPDHATAAGALYAFDAMTLDELWDSQQNASRDGFGNWAKFVSPTVVNGKVYLATHSKQVVAYGLLDGRSSH